MRRPFTLTVCFSLNDTDATQSSAHHYRMEGDCRLISYTLVCLPAKLSCVWMLRGGPRVYTALERTGKLEEPNEISLSVSVPGLTC
ncbi:hypothetical protein BD309DRAFT_963016, partial [Dichomitus squalens]